MATIEALGSDHIEMKLAWYAFCHLAQDVFEACGLEGIEFEVRRQFIFFSMRKPLPAAAAAPVQAGSAPPPPAAPSSDSTINSTSPAASPKMPPRMWTPESN